MTKLTTPLFPPLTWHRAMQYLLDELPEVGADTAPEDWSPEFAHLVALIQDERGASLWELEELEIRISRLRAAVASTQAVDDEDETRRVPRDALATQD